MNNLYFPILKWKKGEKIALSNMSEEFKSVVYPILEIVEEVEAVEFVKELNEFNNIEKIYVDTSIIDEGETRLLEKIISISKKYDKKIFPVLNYYDLKIKFSDLKDDIDEMIVKITLPTDFDGDSYKDIFDFIHSISSENKKVRCLLDLGIITEKNHANHQFHLLVNILDNYLSKIDVYNIIVSVTSFPEDFSSIPAGDEAFYERYDIKLYNAIFNKDNLSQSIKNIISYSDYGVTKFTESEIDFSKLRYGILPKARYTLEDKYWVLKGKRDNYTKEMIKNHRTLAQDISNSDYFYGEDFSYGDRDIKERAIGHSLDDETKYVGPGNHTNWVTNAVSHHIAVVARSLSNLYGSSNDS